MKKELQIGGLIRCTTIDFPGELAAVVFCQGCPWRCHYCHNAALLPAEGQERIPWSTILAFLGQRQGLLDGVVFSGGEPTWQASVVGEAMQAVKQLGMKVALHTNGAYPDRLPALLPFCDWVGMDLKAPFDDYALITHCPESGRLASRSADLLRSSGVPHQFRTTLDPCLFEAGRLEQLVAQVERWGETLVQQPLIPNRAA